jgi:glycosyltransferase involved in cell wall biosynthesis
MEREYDISVVLGTYNRCELLPEAIESLLAQEAGGMRYEIILVDNNSTDRTRDTIEPYLARGDSQLRYLFESQQGVSHARNAGIRAALGTVIAFTDDDVRVSSTWVSELKKAFDLHPEVDYVGGKVVPRWRRAPPGWLTAENWSPLALVDHGDTPFHTNSDRQVCLVGANLALRRQVLDVIGVFSPAFPRGQDHELQRRLWQTGREGLYAPGVVVTADVQTERMKRSYHRRWHRNEGREYAKLRHEQWERPGRRFLDVPLRLYKWAGVRFLQMVLAALRGKQSETFEHESCVWFLVGYVAQRRADRRHAGSDSVVGG